MRKINNLYFLYTGLVILLIAFIIRLVFKDIPSCYFWTLTGIAITLKAIFLINVFRDKPFKPALWLNLILIGVAMIFISMFFKYIYPVFLLRQIFFYGAILLKSTGLILLLTCKKD